MIFKTLNGDLTVFNKTLISTKDHLKALETVSATVYNKNGTFNLQGLLVNSSQSVSIFTKLNNAFKAYNGNLSKSTQLQNAYIQAVGKQNTSLGNYLAGLNGAKASLGGYVKSLVAAKAASIGLQVASVALNTAISMGITLAINALTSQISKWVHAQEEARQKTIELTSSYKEQKDSLDSQIEKYKDLKDTLDNGNLSTDEARSIKEQLLEIQKSLIESYGDEASNIDLVNGKYREQLGLLGELSKEKATDYIVENRDTFEDAKKALENIRTYNLGTITAWNDYTPKTEDQQKLIDYIESYSNLLDLTYQNASGRGVSTTNVNLSVKANVIDADETMHQFAKDLEQYGKDNNIDVSGILEGISEQLKKTWTDELTEYKTIYDEFMKAEIVRNDTLRPLYQQSIQAVEDYNNALLSGEGVEDAKENLDAVQQSVRNATGELEGSQEVFNGIYNGIYNGINKSAESAYNLGLAFENDESVKGYAEQLKGLIDTDLKAINFEDNVQSPGEEAFGALNNILGLSEDEVQNLIDKLVELGYIQGEVQSSTLDDENPISSFEDVWANSFTSDNDAVKELGDTLLNLAEKGRLTIEAFNEADSTDYFKNLGISADEAVAKINKLLDESKQLSSMSSQISSMSEALGTKKSNGFVDADTLAGFDVEVRGLESWDRFQEVLGSTTSSYKECEKAANALATEWVNSSDFLAQLTEQNKEYYETQLEAMGIENYEEVIDSTLALKEAKEALADVDLAEATYEDIEALISEGEYLPLVTEKIWALYAAKLAEQATSIDSSSDCQAMLDLAGDANLTAESIRLLTELMKIYSDLESGVYSESGRDREYAYERAAQIKSEIEKLAKGEGEGLVVNPKLKLNGNGKKSGSGSSKDASKEKYDQELKELEHMHEMGLISDEEYWKARMDLNERYFGESSGLHQKYLDEYQNNEEDILEGLKKLWEDYYNERKNNLKDLISYAGKLYDKEIDSYEDSIKVLEEKRDAEKKHWQEQIDALDDEINALQDANDERERAIDLQNKQWALQKAMHQRTILSYTESGGMVYRADDKAIRDSQNDLDSAENDNKIEDLKKQQKELQKQLDIILETYDSQIESIEKQIDSLKKVKSAWSEIVDNQELKELEERLKSIFGDDVRDKILSGNTDFINSIISQYSDTSDMLRTIEDATLADIQNMVAQYGVLPENLMPIADAAADINNALGTVDTTGFNTNLDNTAQSSSNAAEKVQNVTSALKTLSNDISSYQMPALNTDNFTASLAEDGAILTALKGFTERFRDICDGIPEIWNNSLAEAFGQGGGNGDLLSGGLPNDTKYDALFEPLYKALNNCKTNMEDKLKECLGTFTGFQTDLSGIIGVGGGSSEDSGASQYGITGKSGKASGSENKSESGGGSDTIVGAIQEGGSLIDQALNGNEDSWSASFDTAKESIHKSAESIVECIESMVDTIVSACSAAIEAINMLASADENHSNNPSPASYIRIGHAHSDGTAHIEGTAKVMGDWAVQSDENKALVGEIGRELIVRQGKYFTVGDNGAEMFDIKKGDIVFNHEQTEALLKNGCISGRGKAYADGTVGGGKFLTPDGHILRPVRPGDRAWDLQKAFEPLLQKWLSGEQDILSNAVFEGQRQMEKWTKEITNNSAINNITNNRSVQPVVNHINVTCPGVTEQQVAERLGSVIGKELDRQFNGFHNYAEQISRIT